MNKSVLIVSPSAYVLSGMATWLDYLLQGLADRGWNPVLGLVSGRFHDVERYLAAHPWADSVAIPNPTGSAEGRVRALIEIIRRIRPRVILSVNIPTTYAAVERMRARGVEAPFVAMTNHSVEAHYLADAKAWAHVLDAMIVTNRLIRRLAEEFGSLESSRLYYASCGVQLPAASGVPQRQAGPLRIGYAGRLDEFQKRAHDIPAILAHLERLGVDYVFQVAGGGPYEAILKGLFKE